jgi:hypothetical protein
MNDATHRFSFERPAKWLLFAAVLAAIAVGLAVAFRPERMAPISIFPEGARWKYNVPLPDRWVPIGWGWYWRGKEAIFGKRKSVSVQTMLLRAPASVEAIESKLSLPIPAYVHRDNTRMWVLKTSQLMRIVQTNTVGAFMSMSSANINSADKMAARMFTGTQAAIAGESREIGIALEVWHAHRPEGTDLKATLIATELADGLPLAVITNFCISGRFQIPHGSGLLLLKPGDSGNRSEAIAFTLHPQWK